MPYLRCEACSAKALPIASRCPTCEVPFPEVRPEGYRPCRGCDSFIDPTSEQCRWCDAPVGQGPSRPMLMGAGVGILLLAIAGGAFIAGGSPTSPASSDSIAQSNEALSPVGVAPASPDPVRSDVGRTLEAGESDATEGTGSADREEARSAVAPDAPDEAGPAPESEEAAESTDQSSTPGWVRAVATTFVNIRSAPGSESEVQGVVPRDSEVLLGGASGDWREIRSGDLTGWAWEPLFALSTEGP